MKLPAAIPPTRRRGDFPPAADTYINVDDARFIIRGISEKR